MRILMLLFAFVLVFSTNVFCHNPDSMYVVIKETGIDVIVYHGVSDPEEHYIKKIEVSINGKVAAIKDFTFQTDETTQQVSFDFLTTKKGDVLEIVAYCSQSGKLKKKITV
jgi:desulfoferrodoxin (superoxide reductase-like protein)